MIDREILWPWSHRAAALDALAREVGLGVSDGTDLDAELSEVDRAPARDDFTPPDEGALEDAEREMTRLADARGLAIAAVGAPYLQVDELIRDSSPSIILVRGDHPGLVLVVGRGKRTVPVLARDRTRRRLGVDVLVASLRREVEGWVEAGIDDVIERVDLPPRRRARVRRALLDQQLEPLIVGPCWLLRDAASAGFVSALRRRGIVRHAALLVIGYAVYFAAWLAAWGWIGGTILSGRVDDGALVGWVLVLLTLIPLRLAVRWYEGVLSYGLGAVLRERLLHGVFRTELHEVRDDGAGRHLGRVLEAESLEQLGISGGFDVILASVEIIGALLVLFLGPAPWLMVPALIVFMAVTLLLGRVVFRRGIAWTEARVTVSQDLVERMVGHQTRLTQAEGVDRHAGEDAALDAYLHRSRRLDNAQALFGSVVSRGWVIAGVAGLAPSFLGGETIVPLAIGLGGVLLAHQALGRLSGGLAQLANAAASFSAIRPLTDAARRRPQAGASSTSTPGGDDTARLDVRDVRFAYPGSRAILREASVRIERGDQVLLTGASGSGKSTFAALALGLERPSSGSIFASGSDFPTTGEAGWRRRIGAVPQFHRNHVFTGSLAFNLLMGRRWPPRPEDLELAEEICRDLGLGPLIDRMPGGMMEPVGETGWQLSHGERNRVFVARALLQGSDLLVVDESFAALDPDTFAIALAGTRKHAETLLVIAHP